MLLILHWALLLRIAGVWDQGFRFCDEGYYLLHPITMVQNPDAAGFLYYKHGLCAVTAFWVWLYGSQPSAILLQSGLWGMVGITFHFLLVRRLFTLRIAVISSLVLASLRYILFYHRSHLSDGYALTLFIAGLYCFVRFSGAGSGRSERNGQARSQLLWVVLYGVIAGFAFTVRIQACVTLLGAAVLGAALLMWRHRRTRNCWPSAVRLAGLTLAGVVSVIVGYSSVMVLLGERIDWIRTLEWYQKNLTIAGGSAAGSPAVILQHLFAFSSVPFVIVAIIGLIAALVQQRRQCRIVRLWLCGCTLGLIAIHMLAAMPWPRAHLYIVYLLTIFFAVGVSAIGARCAHMRCGAVVAVAIVILTIAAETVDAAAFFRLRSGYGQAAEFMIDRDAENRKRRHFIGTHSWPVTACDYGRGGYIVYDLPATSYSAFCGAILDLHFRHNVRFMILDLNITYFAPSDVNHLLQEFVLTNPPDLVVANDIANDAQCVADAFHGRPVREDMFSNTIIVYDLAELSQRIARSPGFSYTNDKDMLEQFKQSGRADGP